MQLAPKTAVLLRNGTEVTVPVEQVGRGDVFVVRPGETKRKKERRNWKRAKAKKGNGDGETAEESKR